jgi:hypothetical protein
MEESYEYKYLKYKLKYHKLKYEQKYGAASKSKKPLKWADEGFLWNNPLSETHDSDQTESETAGKMRRMMETKEFKKHITQEQKEQIKTPEGREKILQDALEIKRPLLTKTMRKKQIESYGSGSGLVKDPPIYGGKKYKCCSNCQERIAWGDTFSRKKTYQCKYCNADLTESFRYQYCKPKESKFDDEWLEKRRLKRKILDHFLLLSYEKKLSLIYDLNPNIAKEDIQLSRQWDNIFPWKPMYKFLSEKGEEKVITKILQNIILGNIKKLGTSKFQGNENTMIEILKGNDKSKTFALFQQIIDTEIKTMLEDILLKQIKNLEIKDLKTYVTLEPDKLRETIIREEQEANYKNEVKRIKREAEESAKQQTTDWDDLGPPQLSRSDTYVSPGY